MALSPLSLEYRLTGSTAVQWVDMVVRFESVPSTCHEKLLAGFFKYRTLVVPDTYLKKLLVGGFAYRCLVCT